MWKLFTSTRGRFFWFRITNTAKLLRNIPKGNLKRFCCSHKAPLLFKVNRIISKLFNKVGSNHLSALLVVWIIQDSNILVQKKNKFGLNKKHTAKFIAQLNVSTFSQASVRCHCLRGRVLWGHSWFQSEYEPLKTGREEEKKKKIFNLFLSVWIPSLSNFFTLPFKKDWSCYKKQSLSLWVQPCSNERW